MLKKVKISLEEIQEWNLIWFVNIEQYFFRRSCIEIVEPSSVIINLFNLLIRYILYIFRDCFPLAEYSKHENFLKRWKSESSKKIHWNPARLDTVRLGQKLVRHSLGID